MTTSHRLALALLLATLAAPTLHAQGAARPASLDAFPGTFVPTHVDGDGSTVAGVGTVPGQPAATSYRWRNGAWLGLPIIVFDMAATGNHFTGRDNNGAGGLQKLTVAGNTISGYPITGSARWVWGGWDDYPAGRLSPDGHYVVGSVYSRTEYDAWGNPLVRAAIWTGSAPQELPGYVDPDHRCGTEPTVSTFGYSVTNAGTVFGGEAIYSCPNPNEGFPTWFYGLQWPGPILLQSTPNPWPTPPAGCSATYLSDRSTTVAGDACVWRYDWSWTPLLELLGDQGVDIEGWSNVQVKDLSLDGTVAVGQATRAGATVGFRAVLGRKPMRVALTAEPGVVDVGQAFTATMTVTNLLDTPITNVTPDLLVPTTGATAVVTGPVPDAVPTLAPGATATFTIDMEGAGGYGYAALGARVTADGPDAAPLRARASTILSVREISLLAEIAVPDTVAHGDVFDAVLTLANLTSATIHDVRPDGPMTVETADGAVLTVVAAPPPGAPGQDLLPGQQIQRFYTYSADAPGAVTLRATGIGTNASGDALQPTPAVRTFPVRPVLGLQASLAAAPLVVGEGTVDEETGALKIKLDREYRLTLTVENTGRQRLTDVTPPATLDAAGAGAVALVSGPTPAAPVTLRPGETAEFQYVLHTTGEGPLQHIVTVQGTAPNGDPVVSNDATLGVQISGLVVTVRLLTRAGEVAQATSGRQRYALGGRVRTDQRYYDPILGDQVCVSGCVVVEVTVEDVDGNPVEDAEVAFGATDVDGPAVVTPDQGGGFFCDQDENSALSCGRPFTGAPTDADGVTQAVYWFPGLLTPASTSIKVLVDVDGHVLEAVDTPLELEPTRVDFGHDTVSILPSDASGIATVEFLRTTGQVPEWAFWGGCKKMGEFLVARAGVPTDLGFLRAGKAGVDYVCGKALEKLEGEGGMVSRGAVLVDAFKRVIDITEHYWFFTEFNLHTDGLSQVVLESAGPPFIGFESDFVDAVHASIAPMVRQQILNGAVPTMALELHEVSYHRNTGGVAEEVPALYYHFSTTGGGAPVDHVALVRKGYDPNEWLSEEGVVLATVASPASAGSPTLATSPEASRPARPGLSADTSARAGADYARGQIVMVDYGTPSAEAVQVASVTAGTLQLTTLLRYSHAVGATVSRIDSLAVGAPEAPFSVSRASAVPGASTTPTLAWHSRSPSQSYDVQVATDSLFASVVFAAAGVTADSVTVSDPLAEGLRHYWRVRGTNLLGTGGWSRTYWLQPGRPASDALAGAPAFTVADSLQVGLFSVASTSELNEVTPSCGASVASVWATVTPNESGRLRFDTFASTFDTNLSVWTGSAHPLVEVACNDNAVDASGTQVLQSVVELDVMAGTPYRVRIAGAGASEGLAVLRVGAPRVSALPLLTVSTTADAGPGSLRQAILDANAGSGGSITFAIPGPGPHTIAPLSALPYSTKPLVIDGFTQPGSRPNTAGPWQPTNAVHQVVLSGSLTATPTFALDIRGDDSIVRGLQIVRYRSHAVLLNGADRSAVEGCVIGTDDAGAAGLGNAYSGVWVYHSAEVRVGGPHPGARNVISGNGNNGVLIYGSGASRTTVQGNFIGTTPSGAQARPNALSGVFTGSTAVLNDPAPSQALDVRIGGIAAGAGNLISGNTVFGVMLAGNTPTLPTVHLGDTRVEGNRIGTNAAGTAALPNTSTGVTVRRNVTGITVGGSEPGAGNLVSGNLAEGISVEISNAVVVEGNLVGTDAAGTGRLGNTRTGILLNCSQNAVVRGNVVAASGSTTVPVSGIVASCSYSGRSGAHNRIVGNWIGTDRAGTASLGNTGGGVVVGVRHGDETIGGPLSADGNTIAFNAGPGVLVQTTVTGPVAVRHNALIGNAGLGIDLAPAGTTPNDPGDADAGPNNLQNSPALATVAGNGAASLTVTYTVDTAPANADFPILVDLYLADPAGEEGRTWLGSDTLAVAGTQAPRTVTFTPAAPVADGARVVATATDAAGRTSETSASVATVGSAGGATTHVVAGRAGWRMLSVPLTGSTVATLAAQNLVQGLPDLYPGAGANLFTGYDGTAFTAPRGTSDPLVPGRGLLWYFYDLDINPGGPSVSHALPTTLTVAGPPPADEAVVALHVVGQGWNLIGNPYPFPLRLSNLPAWAEGGALRSAVAQTWDPNAGATGSYVLSSLTGDTVPAWAGAFVQNRDAARLRVPAAADAARPAAGDSAVVHLLAFELTGRDAAGAALVDRSLAVVFRDGAGAGWDLWDAEKLGSLGSPFVEATFAGDRDGESVLRAQASFEASPSTMVEVPLAVQSVGASSSLVLSWPRVEIPETWAVTLLDAETGAVVDLRAVGEYAFEVVPAAPGREAGASGRTVGAARSDAARSSARVEPTLRSARSERASAPAVPVLAARGGVAARFTLRVEPRGATASEPGAPAVFALGRPAPNPSRSATTLAIDVPVASAVRVVVYDALGREVLILADGELAAGRHMLALDAARLAAGVYVVRMAGPDGFAAIRRLTVVR